MVTDVLLNGSLISEAEPILTNGVTESIQFHPVPDATGDVDIAEVLAETEIVIGEWPDVKGDYGVKLVQQVGAGVDSYNRNSFPATAYLCNVYGHGNGVAEHVFSLLLALRRRLLMMDDNLRDGTWPEPDVSGAVQEIGGLSMGIIGFGRIGTALIDPANAFGMEVLGIRSHKPAGTPPDGVRFIGGPEALDDVLNESDVVVLTLPLNDETTGIIDDRELDLIGAEGYLINVARGRIVDEEALYQALAAGRIAGAGIDTWYRYPTDSADECPPSKFPFDELNNVVMTPHIAGWTEATAQHRWEFIAANIDRVARGERPENVVWEPQAD